MSTDSTQAHLFCFGLGYTAQALAARLQCQGFRVSGTVRDLQKSAALGNAGHRVMALQRDFAAPELGPSLAAASHLLLSVPPDAEGDPVFDLCAEQIAACRGFQWIGYLSTTGVYGDRDGGCVNEDSTLEPTGDRGRRRVAAEAAWLDLAARHGLPLHVFRLAGIYGPGRNALRTLLDGKARRIDKPGQVFSRIHVDDIVQVLAASIARPNPGRIYNVCDDEAAPPAEVIAHAAGLMGITPPPLIAFEDAELSPMARSFYRDNKRVANQRIKEELGVRLAYPDYRAGLAALIANET